MTELIINTLRKLSRTMERLDRKVGLLVETKPTLYNSNFGLTGTATSQDTIAYPLDVVTLLSLPNKLRRSAMALCRLGKATIERVAEETRRAKTVEATYLNRLVAMGYIQKRREGPTVYFLAWV